MYKMNYSEEEGRAFSEKDASCNRDLVNRERVNFVVNSLIMRQLRAVSKKEDIPMSRIIDNALTEYLREGTAQRRISPFAKSKEVLLHHLLEMVIHERMEEKNCAILLEEIKKYFPNYICTSAILNLDSPNETIIGTKVFLFLNDGDSMQFAKFLNFISLCKEQITIEIRLDNEDIKLDKTNS